MGKPSVPAAPDYSTSTAGSTATATSDLTSADQQRDIGIEQLGKQDTYSADSAATGKLWEGYATDAAAYGKQNYEQLVPYLQNYLNSQYDYDQSAQDYLDVSTKSAEESRTRSKDLYDRYLSVYAPKEDQYTEDAFAYGSKARQDEAAAAARGDVSTSYGAVKDEAVRSLQSYGVDPSQGAFGRTQVQDITRAAALAAAGTYARTEQEKEGYKREGEALKIGQTLVTGSEKQSELATTESESGLKGSAIGGKALETGSNLLTSGTTAMGSPTTYASYSNPYTSLAGAYGTSSTGAFSNQQTALGNASKAYSDAASDTTSSYSAQLENYKAKGAQSTGTLSGIGKLVGTAASIAAI